MKNKTFSHIAAEAWEPMPEADNEDQFQAFLKMLAAEIDNGTRSDNSASSTLGRAMIEAHLGSVK